MEKRKNKRKMKQVRVHDLRHTFGQILRANGVSLEDRQDLLSHTSRKITTHYCAPNLQRLIDAANSVCEDTASQPVVPLLRLNAK